MEWSSNTKKYIYGPGMDNPVAMINVSGANETWYYYYADALGSIRLLSDAGGAIVESYTYLAFGQPTVMTNAGTDGNWLTEDGTTINTSAVGNPYLFTARRWDVYTQLYYYRLRDYSPLIGRFLQPDPLGYIDGLNLYAYVNNNPLNWIDPWGLCKDDKGVGEKIIDAIEALENSAAGEFLNLMNDGFCAWIDGVIPFGDPLDDTYEGMGFSKGMGMVSGTAATTAVGLGVAGVGSKLGLHGAHHTFGAIGKQPHLQINLWRSGIKGSGIVGRLPLKWW